MVLGWAKMVILSSCARRRTGRYFGSASSPAGPIVASSIPLKPCSRATRSISATAASGCCIGSVAMPRGHAVVDEPRGLQSLLFLQVVKENLRARRNDGDLDALAVHRLELRLGDAELVEQLQAKLSADQIALPGLGFDARGVALRLGAHRGDDGFGNDVAVVVDHASLPMPSFSPSWFRVASSAGGTGTPRRERSSRRSWLCSPGRKMRS